jgi:hypothetical protein
LLEGITTVFDRIVVIGSMGPRWLDQPLSAGIRVDR